MALNIEGATLGFDANNVQAAINSLNTEVIENTKVTMNQKLSELRTAVDTIWVGASAEQFKKNMEFDVNKICSQLDETKKILEEELYNIVNKMGELDQNLIKGRE